MRTALTLSCILVVSVCVVNGQDELPPGQNYEVVDEDEPLHNLVAPAELETTRSYQEEKLTVRRFDNEKWKQVVDGRDYREENEEKTKESSASDRRQPSIAWGSLIRLLGYGVALAAALAVLYLIVRNVSLDFKVKKVTKADPENPVEDIVSVDTTAMLDNAIRDGNLKLAVRLYYLSLLKTLNREGLIIWKKDKTNRDYLNELLSKNFFFDEIRKLTFSYELVWYGDHDVRPESFQAIKSEFESVLERVNNRERP